VKETQGFFQRKPKEKPPRLFLNLPPVFFLIYPQIAPWAFCDLYPPGFFKIYPHFAPGYFENKLHNNSQKNPQKTPGCFESKLLKNSQLTPWVNRGLPPVVPLSKGLRQYTNVGIQADLMRRLQGEVVNLMVQAEVRRTGFCQLLGEVLAIRSSLESMNGALELKLAAWQSQTLEMPGGFQPIILEGELSPASEFEGSRYMSELPEEEKVEEVVAL